MLYLVSGLKAYAGLLAKRLTASGTGFLDDTHRKLAAGFVECIHPPVMKLRATEIIEEALNTKTLRFERLDGPVPPFVPGRYVNLHVEIDNIRTSRPYSISSHPGAGHIDLTVSEKPGGFVSPYLVGEVKPGDIFESSGPAGSFRFEPLIDRGALVMLAGGSGITPFMSMLRFFEAEGWPLPVHLIYGCRTPGHRIFGGEIDRLTGEHDVFDAVTVCSEPPAGFDGISGFIDATLISDRIGDVSGKTFLICGPNAMYEFCTGELEKLGVPRHKIRRERFGPPDDITRAPGWPQGIDAETTFEMMVEGKGPVTAAAGEPVLNTLERNGIASPAKCRSGECSACRAKLLAGKVYELPDTGVREADRSRGYIHACVSYPLSDLEIRL